MKNKINKHNEFIIQNFRSWEGKTYIPLNRMNFLFGGNSSGKSSILAAMSLWKQSLNDEQNLQYAVPFRLILNGSEINLGQSLQRQFHFSVNQSRDDWRSSSIAFGCRYNQQDLIQQMFERASSSEMNEATVKFARKIKNIEFISYYDFIDGKIQGIDFILNRKRFLTAKFDIESGLEIEFSTNNGLLEELFEASEKFDYLTRLREANGDFAAIDELPPRLYEKWIKLEGRTREFINDQSILLDYDKQLKIINEKYEAALEAKDKISSKILRFKGEKDELKQRLELEHSNFIKKFGVAHTTSGEDYFYNCIKEIGGPLAAALDWTSFDKFNASLKPNSKFTIPNHEWAATLEEPTVFILQLQNLFSLYARPSEPRDKLDFVILAMNYLFPKNFDLGEFVRTICMRMGRLFQTMVQIGPFREMPDRVGVIDSYKTVKSVGKSGENILDLLHQNIEKPEVIHDINSWLEKLEIGYSIDVSFNEEFSAVKLLLEDKDGLNVQLHDVGYGVSQVLPIVMQAMLSQNILITIEQPELHIHPRLQANLADLFVWSAAKKGNRFIIETHSEHLMLRLQRRQKDNDQILAADEGGQNWSSITDSVNICVIEKYGEPASSKISKLKIDSKGFFDGEWPGGFFEERFVEKGLK